MISPFSMKGLCHKEMAAQAADPAKNTKHLRVAENCCASAAPAFPEDDENHACTFDFFCDVHGMDPLNDAFHSSNSFTTGFLCCALECLFLAGAQLKFTLPMMERIRLVTPKMKFIWEYGSMHQSRTWNIQRFIELEEDVRKGLATGKLSMEDKLRPSWAFRHNHPSRWFNGVELIEDVATNLCIPFLPG